MDAGVTTRQVDALTAGRVWPRSSVRQAAGVCDSKPVPSRISARTVIVYQA